MYFPSTEPCSCWVMTKGNQLIVDLYIDDMTESVKDFENCKNPEHNENTEFFGENCKDCGVVPSYADDASFVCSNKVRNLNKNKIEKKLTEIKEYLNTNELTINSGKTVISEIMIPQKRGKTKGEPPQITEEKSPGIYKIIRQQRLQNPRKKIT